MLAKYPLQSSSFGNGRWLPAGQMVLRSRHMNLVPVGVTGVMPIHKAVEDNELSENPF